MKTYLYKVNRRLCLFIVLSIFALRVEAQTFVVAPMKQLPEAISNNAVVSAIVGEIQYVYSFGGIDSSKSYSGIHRRSYRLQTNTNLWEAIPSLPDTMGKLGTAASFIRNKIYITGGYHVLSSGAEVTSNKVHVYDPQTNAFLPDAPPMPVPVKDHVQVVWRDSLLYIISGWSNNSNVANVQIYNPSTNLWQIGTPVPNQANFKVFGASGVVIGDTIYYAGGAIFSAGFPLGTVLRKGTINPSSPAQINWTSDENLTFSGYRMGVGSFGDKAIWIGGSLKSFNYDGIAYDGSGGVHALDRIQIYHSNSGTMTTINDIIPNVMDLRGLAKISPNQFVVAGGMTDNQTVSRSTFLLTIEDFVGISDDYERTPVRLYPYPAHKQLFIDSVEPAEIILYNIKGNSVLNYTIDKGSQALDVSLIPDGFYIAAIYLESNPSPQYLRVTIQH